MPPKPSSASSTECTTRCSTTCSRAARYPPHVTAARRKLLDAILADPDDDELRSVYADALAEAGDIEHADLVHAQLAIARGAGEKLVALAKELETKHGRRIAGTIADHASAWSFDRGLI